MTAVLEPQAAGQSVPVAQGDELPLQPAASFVPGEPAAPFHCGVAMTAAPVPVTSLGWAPLELGAAEWSCTCGYTMDGWPDGDPLEAVRLASARVESVQWELDAAQERFETAVQGAARLGAGQEALGRAAGLTVEELRDILGVGDQS
ncbi:hypothetical protein [Pseudarthrobacter sp. BRE9]|uniref:hypothetical protein n=1 Tax=Pseudarthrobacter sp. BRE9 TaxID=2962582 RepID=UPI0028821604|nr:hypothetical protein [Pseudarthrobacter sp. BRE9]MDT0168060.1 hypothetical protein [Pseudarthrobacter sp. BRE9]